MARPFDYQIGAHLSDFTLNICTTVEIPSNNTRIL